jgi:hypothetical protein
MEGFMKILSKISKKIIALGTLLSAGVGIIGIIYITGASGLISEYIARGIMGTSIIIFAESLIFAYAVDKFDI